MEPAITDYHAKFYAYELTRLHELDGLLVAGSSPAVWSGYRFVRGAVQEKIPVAMVNLGQTRTDADLSLKIEASCGATLAAVADALCGDAEKEWPAKIRS